jgi:hypothetical protein
VTADFAGVPIAPECIVSGFETAVRHRGSTSVGKKSLPLLINAWPFTYKLLKNLEVSHVLLLTWVLTPFQMTSIPGQRVDGALIL